jgi:hypothetical protein
LAIPRRRGSTVTLTAPPLACATAQTGGRRAQILFFVALDHGGTDDHPVRMRILGTQLETTMTNTTLELDRNKTANREKAEALRMPEPGKIGGSR